MYSVTFGMIFRIIVLKPIRQGFTEPLVILSTLFLIFNFGVLSQWFISVPAALDAPSPMSPGFTIDRIGIAISLTGIVGCAAAAIMSSLIE